MNKRYFIIALGLIVFLVLGGCGNSRKEYKVLDTQLTKVVDAYFKALKAESKDKLYPVVYDTVYSTYTPSQIAIQRNLLGKIISWEIDREATPPFINANASQAVYTVNLKTTKQNIVMEVDLRSMWSNSWRVYGVSVKKHTPALPSDTKAEKSKNSSPPKK